MNDFISKTTAAAIFGCSLPTFDRKTKLGQIPPAVIIINGRAVAWSREQCEQAARATAAKNASNTTPQSEA